jgi:hypothetical protein
MSLFKNVLRKKENGENPYQKFWAWFQKNEKTFHQVVKNNGDIEKDFFHRLERQLDKIKEGFLFLTGMVDDKVELVFTPDGDIKNIFFVEELVKAAPQLDDWLFTALKPPLDITEVSIEMAGYEFSAENIYFFANEHKDFPDEIDICIIHEDLNQENKRTISHGIYIFLDNYLGELNFATNIDALSFIEKSEAQQELISISKLKDYLIWRQKEFIEKYEGVWGNKEYNTYTILSAELENGNMIIANINTDLLHWDSKPSHPWILKVGLSYQSQGNIGMPTDKDSEQLGEIEDLLLSELIGDEGYLNIGRQTAENVREIYFACKDFRKPSQVAHEIQLKYAKKLEINYEIYKDKYWQSFNHYMS